ncbi:MAG: hypothetical protein ABSD20_05705 [Terriglobales bacterium]
MLINKAVVTYDSTSQGGSVIARGQSGDESHMLNILAEAFQDAGWRIGPGVRAAALPGGELLVRKGNLAYAVDLKRASEGRPDRLIPLLSQSILQIRKASEAFGPEVSPLAVVAAPRIPESVADQIKRFADKNAPEVAVGVFDLEGMRSFHGPGLEGLNRERPAPRFRINIPIMEPSNASFFSGVNQWLLKVLLAPKLPESLLAAPREEYRNASQLAKGASVSVMSAFRFIKQMQEEGFLDESNKKLRLVRVKDLMKRWQAASLGRQEYRMKWLIRNNASDALYQSVRKFLAKPSRSRSGKPNRLSGRRAAKHSDSPLRVCVGLFAAAELLGLSFVHGGPQHLYAEQANPELFQALGLVSAREGESVDVFVRIPLARAAIFRAAVDVRGVPASDVLQIWLDVSVHPSRGKAQADEIWHRVLAKCLEEK